MYEVAGYVSSWAGWYEAPEKPDLPQTAEERVNSMHPVLPLPGAHQQLEEHEHYSEAQQRKQQHDHVPRRLDSQQEELRRQMREVIEEQLLGYPSLSMERDPLPSHAPNHFSTPHAQLGQCTQEELQSHHDKMLKFMVHMQDSMLQVSIALGELREQQLQQTLILHQLRDDRWLQFSDSCDSKDQVGMSIKEEQARILKLQEKQHKLLAEQADSIRKLQERPVKMQQELSVHKECDVAHKSADTEQKIVRELRECVEQLRQIQLGADTGQVKVSAITSGSPTSKSKSKSLNPTAGIKNHDSVLRPFVDLKKVDQEAYQSTASLAELRQDQDNSKTTQTAGFMNMLRGILLSAKFEFFSVSIVLMNTVVMCFELQHAGVTVGDTLGIKEQRLIPQPVADSFPVVNDVFLCVYAVESLIKFFAFQCGFFRDKWNVTDLILVSLGVLDRLAQGSIGINPMAMRLVRLMKLTRMMKVVKAAHSLESLSLIFKAVRSTLGTLVWSMLLLFMIQLFTGIVLSQMTSSYLNDGDAPMDARQAVYKYYGTFTRTQFTIFEITHVNYSRAARVLTDHVSEYFAIFFMAYRAFVAFAVCQVIRAVFIQRTLRVAEKDRELMLQTRRRNTTELQNKLSELFHFFDLDRDGVLEADEFVHAMDQDVAKLWLGALEIEACDSHALFHLLDLNGTGVVDHDEFVHGASRLRGPARSIDMFYMMDRVQRMEAKLDTLLPPELQGPMYPNEVKLNRA